VWSAAHGKLKKIIFAADQASQMQDGVKMDLLNRKRKLSDFGRIISLPNAENVRKNLSRGGWDALVHFT